MAEEFKGYRDIPEADQKKAKEFFDRGKTVADSGNFEYAIEMYLQGLAIDPDAVDAHQQLFEISMRRKAMGNGDLGMMEKMKLKRGTKDDKQNMLNAEKLLAYNPGDTDSMVTLLQSAHRAGFYDTVLWIGPRLLRANADSKKPQRNKFLILKDVYKDLNHWKRATEACNYALKMDPNDMDLQSELKNLGAQDTINDGGYDTGGSFRHSIRDREKQEKLMIEDKDVRSVDQMARQIHEAEEEYKRDPIEGKLIRLVEVLTKTEDPEHENHAVDLLEEAYGRTRQFRFRQKVGAIKMTQMRRMERSIRAQAQAAPQDEALRKDYEQFRLEQLEFELSEYKLWAEAYPSDNTLKLEVGRRLFALKRFDEAIPVLQEARNDPKHKIDASITLGCAFLEAGFVDESIETLQAVLDEYQLKGDDRSKLMYYWQGRAFEAAGNLDQALKRYSQVAQWEFTYRDVQGRIKKLRAGGGPTK